MRITNEEIDRREVEDACIVDGLTCESVGAGGADRGDIGRRSCLSGGTIAASNCWIVIMPSPRSICWTG